MRCHSQPPTGSMSATGTLLIGRAEFPLKRSRESFWKRCCTVWSSSSPMLVFCETIIKKKWLPNTPPILVILNIYPLSRGSPLIPVVHPFYLRFPPFSCSSPFFLVVHPFFLWFTTFSCGSLPTLAACSITFIAASAQHVIEQEAYP